MLAGMMVTSNVLPAYSATDGIAVEQSDASYEGQAADSEASADAGNSEAGGASSEQDDSGKPVADAGDSDSATDASANAGDESHVAGAAAGSASSAAASNNAEMNADKGSTANTENSAVSGDTSNTDSSENTGAASDEEDANSTSNTGAATSKENGGASSGTENTGAVSGAENTGAAGTVGTDTSSNTGASSGTEKSDVIVLETSAASTEAETTGAATETTGGTVAGSDVNVSGGTSTGSSGAGITTGAAGAGSTALGESAVETGAVETTPAETLESVPETTVEETTVPESTEAAKKVKLSFHVVDEDGEDIDEKYADVKVSFDKEGVLTLDDSEKAPVRNIRKLTGTRLFGLLKTYSKNYTYKEATLDGDIIRAIRKTTDEDEHTVYEYTMDGEDWTAFEEDSEILLVYCAPETKGSGHAEYIEEGKIKVVVDLKKELPEGVELRVQEVTDEDQNYDAYMTALDDAAKASASEIEKHSNENTLLYDIAFIGHDEDGEEYEYQPGEDVSVKVSFLGGQLAGELGASDADNVVIKHLPVKDEVKENAAKDGQRTTADMTDLSADDIKVEDVKKAKVTLDTEAKIATVDVEEDEDEEKEVAESKDEVTFKTDSFSVYAFTDQSNDDDFSKVNWNKDFVKLNSKTTIDGKSSKLYYFDDKLSEEDIDKLGGRGNIKLEYHCITDDSETFTGGNSNEDNDTTGYKADRALGIAGNFHIVAFGTAHLGAHTNGNVLASTLEAGSNFGTNKHNTPFGQESSYVYTTYATVNGSSAAANGDVLALGKGIELNFQDNGNAFGVKGKDNNFHKLDRPCIVYKDSDTKKYIDINDVKDETKTLSAYLASKKSTISGNNGTFTITNPNGVEYVSLTPDEVVNLPTDVWFDGFKSGCNGSIIVNVDMSDMADGATLTLPERAKIKIDGEAQSTGEVVEFSAGKVIWNFVHAEGKKITAKNMSGSIIALGASVELSQNLNGTVIAQNVNVRAETHRSDFTGIIRPTSIDLGAVKHVNNAEPAADQKYSFNLEELKDGVWSCIKKKKNTGSEIKFSQISYGSSEDCGDHWYRITEDQTTETGVRKDASQYIVKVEVSSQLDDNGNETYVHTDTCYRVEDATQLINSDKTLNTSVLKKVISEDYFIFNNVIDGPVSETVDISGEKTWNDNDNEDHIRPSEITVQVKNGDAVVDSKKVKADSDGKWTYSFTGLPKYDADGKEISYEIAEVAVPGYTPTYDGNNITNTHTHETVDISGEKTWDDNDNRDGIRPKQITVEVKNGETVVKSLTVEAGSDGKWTYHFTALPKYDETGNVITYTVDEVTVPGYKTIVNDNDITNTHTPATTSVLVKKTWDDSNDASGKRPSAITVKLYADHVLTAEKTLTADASGDWSYEFTDLPMYKAGKVGQKINYTVTEEEMPGYVLTDSESSTKDSKTVVQLTNKSIDFKVNKFERTGTRELDGAKIQIKDSTGAVIAEWISKSGETHDFGSSLKVGETYTIHEETAPSGYYTISDVNFTVDEKGQITLAGSSDDVKLEDGVIKICDERIKSSGGGGGGDHPHPTPETTPAETTPAETTVPETTPVETTNPGGGNGGHHDPSEEVETDEFGNVLGANRGKNRKQDGQNGGNVKGANRGKTRTGDESMMSIFGFGFLAAVLVLLGWFGIRFTKRNRR